MTTTTIETVKVMNATASDLDHETPAVRFTVPGSYGDVQVDERTWWPSFEEAVAAARSTIERFDYRPVVNSVRDSRAFVALRCSHTLAPKDGVSLGSDEELMRWEVFRDRVALVPTGQGGLTGEQAEAVSAAVPPRRGFA